jgi:hypothetical protein
MYEYVIQIKEVVVTYSTCFKFSCDFCSACNAFLFLHVFNVNITERGTPQKINK